MNVLRREKVRGVTIITLEIQSLDAANASYVTECLVEAMQGEAQAVVDLGTLRHFDVSGFAAILKWVTGGSEVRLCSRYGTIHALLELLQADTLVPLYQSRDEAMASLRGLDLTQRKSADVYSRDEDPLPGRRTA
jgi:ABC-type transporter Mla MlaB component